MNVCEVLGGWRRPQFKLEQKGSHQLAQQRESSGLTPIIGKKLMKGKEEGQKIDGRGGCIQQVSSITC